MQTFLIEAAGWIGALLILAAYGLLSTGRVDGQSRLYQGMNVVGAAGFIVNGLAHQAIPSAVLNIVWMGIGIYTLAKVSRRKRAAD